ncbi:MAG: cbb3-type cytochrome c oxidase subunit 3 [Pseudomonadota bacterium]
MYETLSSFAQTGGLILFVAAFALIVAYALLPNMRETFKRAANLTQNEPPEPTSTSGEKESRP